MKKKVSHLLLVVLPAAAAVLNGLPKSVRMRFADQDGPFYAYESGFSMIPVGYANWGHMLSGIGACILLVLALVYFFRPQDKLRKVMTGISITATAVLVRCMVLFGSGTLYSWAVAILLAAEAMLLLKIRI